METKRLTFDIPLELHNRLKAEASAKGVSLGSHCTSILEGEVTISPSFEVDQTTLSYLSLSQLRDISQDLLDNRPTDWKRQVANVNMEMRRRFKT
jgi:hypothetical protein